MARPARSKVPASPLVGRDAELDHLERALHGASSGEGRIELVYGEPGVGKTRLLDEVARHAASRGAAVFSACCPDDPGTPPYWPWSQLLSSIVPGMERRVLVDALGANASLFVDAFPEAASAVRASGRPRSGSDTHEAARFRLFDAVTRLLHARSRNQTLVLLLDDLHWADEPSLKLLVHVCGEVHRSHVLLVGAYRNLEFELGHILPAAIGRIGQGRNVGRVLLHGLSEADSSKLLAKGIGAQPAQELCRKVFLLTDGNPLFISLIVQLLTDEPGADSAPGGLAIGVRDVIARRLAHLSKACREAVAVAAVLGSEFAASFLAKVADLPSAEAGAAAVDEAQRERIIEETGSAPGSYRFTHALIREAILSSLPLGRRARLHARALEVLETNWQGEMAAHASEMLFHAAQAQEIRGPEPVARYALLAGETALRAHAFEDAQRGFATGLAALQHHPMDDLKAALTFGSAKARCAWDMSHETRGLFARCFEYWEGREDTAKMMEVLSYDHFVIPEPVLLPLYERALDRVAADDPGRARLLAYYGFNKAVNARTGVDGARELHEALELARRQSDQWLEMRILWLSVFAGAGGRGFEERYARLRQADALARKLGDRADEMWIRGAMVGELLNRGRIDEAAGLASRMSGTAERQGDLIDRHHARSAELQVAWYRAEWDTVRALSSDILERSPPLYLADGFYLCQRCEAACQTSEPASWKQDLKRLVDTTRAVPRVPANIFLNCASTLATVSRLTGDPPLLEESRDLVQFLLDMPDVGEGKRDCAHQVLARLCVLRVDKAGAAGEYENLAGQLERAEPGDRPFCRPTHELLGALASLQGNLDRAVAHYEDALGAAGYPVHERAWIEHDFSRVLSSRRAPGDLDRARNILGRCIETAERTCLVPLARHAREALASLGCGSREVRLDGLTDREFEVLALIVRGLTNREIGEKLFISTKTVDTHVRNILEKTGTANRTEAAAYAIWHKAPGV
jgi:DNA-binding CsgD family transcriptional regulator